MLIAQLTTHPDQLALLRADPSLWPNAVEVVTYESGPPRRRRTRVLRGYDAMPVQLTTTVDA